jgi:hypothetical protein
MYVYVHMHTYIDMYMCVCVCVFWLCDTVCRLACFCTKKTPSKRELKADWLLNLHIHTNHIAQNRHKTEHTTAHRGSHHLEVVLWVRYKLSTGENSINDAAGYRRKRHLGARIEHLPAFLFVELVRERLMHCSAALFQLFPGDVDATAMYYVRWLHGILCALVARHSLCVGCTAFFLRWLHGILFALVARHSLCAQMVEV